MIFDLFNHIGLKLDQNFNESSVKLNEELAKLNGTHPTIIQEFTTHILIQIYFLNIQHRYTYTHIYISTGWVNR